MEYNLKDVILEEKKKVRYNFIELLKTEVTNCMLFSYHNILFFKRTAMV